MPLFLHSKFAFAFPAVSSHSWLTLSSQATAVYQQFFHKYCCQSCILYLWIWFCLLGNFALVSYTHFSVQELCCWARSGSILFQMTLVSQPGARDVPLLHLSSARSVWRPPAPSNSEPSKSWHSIEPLESPFQATQVSHYHCVFCIVFKGRPHLLTPCSMTKVTIMLGKNDFMANLHPFATFKHPSVTWSLLQWVCIVLCLTCVVFILPHIANQGSERKGLQESNFLIFYTLRAI